MPLNRSKRILFDNTWRVAVNGPLWTPRDIFVDVDDKPRRPSRGNRKSPRRGAGHRMDRDRINGRDITGSSNVPYCTRHQKVALNGHENSNRKATERKANSNIFQRMERKPYTIRYMRERLRAYRIRPVWINYSRTAHGWHIHIHVNHALNARRVVAIQRALGSDPIRETHNEKRTETLAQRSPFFKRRWNLLYDRKI